MFSLFFNALCKALPFLSNPLIKLIASFVGPSLDSNLFGGFTGNEISISSLFQQRVSEDVDLPIIYGRARVSGDIIWLSEVECRRGKRASSMKVSIAILICAGEMRDSVRIFCNDSMIEPSDHNIRFYAGSEDQSPDSLLQVAYRGVCYVVFEDFDLSDFNNVLPKFSFEVESKKMFSSDSLEHKIKGVNVVGATGLASYDTQIQTKLPQEYSKVHPAFVPAHKKSVLNAHEAGGAADSLASLSRMRAALPNLQWVSITVAWFGSSLNIKSCKIKPGVEFKRDIVIYPDACSVAGYTMKTAANTIYGGGTPSDIGLMRYIRELKKYGYKILLYPILIPNTRDRNTAADLTGDVKYLDRFFNEQYNPFILHYAKLCSKELDAIIIGAEMTGLTRLQEKPSGGYPAVAELASLASSVKQVVGESCMISYAASYDELHGAEDENYNLDDLWASEAIDFVGLNAYIPLTHQRDLEYDSEVIKECWRSHESHSNAKSIKKWWSSRHYRPDGRPTKWKARSKKIWFIEYGFLSTSCCASHPRISNRLAFTDDTIEALRCSKADLLAQRAALQGSVEYWEKQNMVANMFLWCWDIRTSSRNENYGDVYHKGYCIQDKLMMPDLKAVIQDLAMQSEIENIECNNINKMLEGFIIYKYDSLYDILSQLAFIYDLSLIFEENKLSVTSKKHLTQSNIVIPDDAILRVEQNDHISRILTQIRYKIVLSYINKDAQNKVSTTQTRYDHSESTMHVSIPIITTEHTADYICNKLFHDILNRCVIYQLLLAFEYVWIKPGHIICVDGNNIHILEVYITEEGISCTGMIQQQYPIDMFNN